MHGDEALASAVRSVNALTSRWMHTFDEHDDVVGSGLGVWAVLAALLIGASGPARDELGYALGLSPDEAPTAAATIQALTDAEAAFHMATGLWSHASIGVYESFVAACGFATVGDMPSRQVLDAWAHKHTNGLITSFPIEPSPNAMMLLASAVVADLEWQDPFRPKAGSWAAAPDAPATLLRVSTPELGKAAVLDHGGESVSRFICSSTSSIDVHLVSGEAGAGPGSVLGCAIRALTDEDLVTPVDMLEVGDRVGVLSVREVAGVHDHVRVDVPAFSIKQSHDLLAFTDLWGLRAASDPNIGHFGQLSDEPLAIDEGVQDALVEFNALGFKAAAVTVVRAVRSARPRQRPMCQQIKVVFNRPFGYLAVHRPTGLVLFSGWVGTEAALTPPAA